MNWIIKLLTLALCASAVAQNIDDAALEKLKLPGIKINAKEKYVDVDGTICLDSGALEVVACTKDTKEHESIIQLGARPVHIHMALLLIGATPGTPAMQKQVGEGEEKRWMFYPASGQPIEVSLIHSVDGGKELMTPIAEFIQKITEEDGAFPQSQEPKEERKMEKFPTSIFLFMGSHLIENGEGPKRYIAEESGNVITISTFGDEMLGMSEQYSSSNGSLLWEINSEKTPAVGTKVRLRLKPIFAAPVK